MAAPGSGSGFSPSSFTSDDSEEPSPEISTPSRLTSCGFQVHRRLGAGTYGEVYSVITSPEEKTLHALKYIKPSKGGLSSLNDIDVLSRIFHPYVLHTEGLRFGDESCPIDTIGIVLPLASYTLETILDNPFFTTDMKIKVFQQLVAGAVFLHHEGIIHADIKAANVLLFGDLNSENLIAKLNDFGLSEYVDNPSVLVEAPVLINPQIKPPEGNVRSEYTTSWQLGMLWYHLFTGKNLVPSLFRTLEDYYTVLLTPEWFTLITNAMQPYLLPEYSEDILDLLRRMLIPEIPDRIKTADILEHQLFQRFPHQEPPDGEVYLPLRNPPPQENFRTGIEFLTSWAYRYLPNAKVEVLFLALDLYYRVPDLGLDSQEDTPLLAFTCFWMALKMIDLMGGDKLERLIQDTYIPERPESSLGSVGPTILIVNFEIQIVYLLKGILYPRYLFHASRSPGQLRAGLEMLVNHPEEYARLDLVSWELDGRFPPETKEISIGDFLGAEV